MVLLLVVMVSSILMVLVGQFSRAVLVDRTLAENHLRDLQARLDLAGAEALLRALAPGGGESPFTLEIPSGRLTLEWEGEAGKFNLNNLRDSRFPAARAQLELLFQRLEDGRRISELGLCEPVAELVLGAGRPLLCLGELRRIQGVTPEVLAELSAFLTVYTDGKIDPREASDEVLRCLDEGIGGKTYLEQLKKRLDDPQARVPAGIDRAARRIEPYIATGGGAWCGVATLAGRATTRRAEVALRVEGSEVRTILFNELEEAHGRRGE